MEFTTLVSELQEANVILASGVVNSHGTKILSKTPSLNRRVHDATSFLSDGVSLSQRIYCIRNGINHKPECENPACSNIPKFNNTTGFSRFCSSKCANQDPTKKQTIAETNQTKYGGHPLNVDTIRAKRRETMIELYGAEYTLQSAALKEKAKSTTIERYGVEYHQQSAEGKEQRAVTTRLKLGVDFPFQSPEIQDEIRQTVFERYGVKSTAQLEVVKDKAKQTNIDRYGVQNHQYVNILTQQQIEEQLNNKEWLIEQHHTLGKSLTEIAMDLGLRDEKSISYQMRRYDIEIRQSEGSIGQKMMFEFIVDAISDPSVEVLYNTRDVITPYELDIYIPTMRLAFEYCGLYWHSELFRAKTYHVDKMLRCEQLGITLITIFEDEWIGRQAIVKNKLMALLGKDPRETVFARKCDIRMVSNQDKTTFFDTYHIQGDGPSTFDCGLYTSDGTLVACLSVLEHPEKFILNRFATARSVPGGFSKLLKFFMSNFYNDDKPLVTFADLRWSTGKLYEQTGFVLDAILPPSYAYVVNNKRVHKFNFRKKRLQKILREYDPLLSEHQNMLRHNIFRCYDCGLKRFVYAQKK